MKCRAAIALVPLLIAVTPAVASEIDVGLLSFDVFIPPGVGPGVNAFDIFNFTGPSYGPVVGSPYVADSLSLDSAVLTVFFLGGSSQVFTLGDIGPGELSPSDPLVQFPSTAQFAAATLTATLSQTTFTLSDGSAFNALPSISIDLTPSSGAQLTAGVDFSAIYAQSSNGASPEPGTAILAAFGVLGLAVRRRW